jgi:nitrogen regulatory protein PII
MASPMAGTEHKLITCFLPLGVAPPLAKALKSEKGIATAHISNARGIGKLTSSAHRQLGDQTEKQILTVVVGEDDADDVFAFIYFEAKIDRPHGGLIYMSSVGKHVPLILPELPDEDI